MSTETYQRTSDHCAMLDRAFKDVKADDYERVNACVHYLSQLIISNGERDRWDDRLEIIRRYLNEATEAYNKIM